MTLYTTLMFIFFASFLAVALLLLFFGRLTNPARKRLENLAQADDLEQLAQDLSVQDASGKRKMNPQLEHFLARIGKISTKQDKETAKLSYRLAEAGYHLENGPIIFVGIQIFLAVSLSLGYLTLFVLGNSVGMLAIFVSVMMAWLGYRLPEFILSRKISSRQNSVSAGLVDALDLLIICVEAGLGLNAAILRVGQDLKLRAPVLGEEFILMNKEMRAGLSREQALRNLTLRNKVEDLKILVSSIILADRLGTSIADTLRAQADSLRVRISQRAEEQAGKASIKMLFPLVIFIFPALFIIILVPGLLTVIKVFSEVSGP